MFRTDATETRARGPVTCAACGCRLQASTGAQDGEYKHFGGFDGRDARGCRVDCVTLVHDTDGVASRETIAA